MPLKQKITENIINTKQKENGKKIFQHNRISWSTRYRGKDARTQIKKKRTKEVFKPKIKGSIRKARKKEKDNQPPTKSKIVSKLIKIIEPYSAKKKRAKPIDAYSTLKPETSSDSASGKSKGARLVSAKIEIKNIKNNGKNGVIKNVKF